MPFPYSKIQAAHAFAPGLQLSESVSFTSNVTKGNLLIFWFGNGIGNSLTDTQGNTWHPLSSTSNFGAGSNIAISYTTASATGPCTVTVANTVTQEVWCIGVVEYGMNTPTVDKNSGTASLGTGNGKCPTPITTGVPNSLVIAVAIGTTAGGSPDLWTIDSGFTVDDTMTSVPFNAGFCVGSLNVAGAGVLQNPTFTNSHWTFGIDVTEGNFTGIASPGIPLLPPSQTSVARPPVNLRVINLPKICSRRKPRCPLPIQVGKAVFVGPSTRK